MKRNPTKALVSRGVFTFLMFLIAQGSASHWPELAANDAEAVTTSRAGKEIPGQYIVVLKQDAAPREAVSKAGAADEVMHFYDDAINGFSIKTKNAKTIDDLRKLPTVAFIEPDREIVMFGQTVPTGIDRVDADLSSSIAGDGSGNVDTDIAILDTGVDLDHPDLNVFRQITFVKKTSSADDDNGHGTHVAGIAAAKDNDVGVVGVAPGARVWAVKVLNQFGVSELSSVLAALDYVVANSDEIDVVNMSFGCVCATEAGNLALDKVVSSGVPIVAAAGNNARDVKDIWPAGHPGIIAVSAIVDTDGKCGGSGASTPAGLDDAFALFSNFGPGIDFSAPGVSILSTYPDGQYNTLSGTSIAAPHIAGALGLHRSIHPGVPASGSLSELATLGSNPDTVCDGKGHGYFKGDRDGNAEPLLYLGVKKLQNVEIDVKPGSDKNTVNLNSKELLRVAILSTDSFDAREVDSSSVAFGPAGAKSVRSKIMDTNHDGIPDMLLFFRIKDTGLACGQVSAALSGHTVSEVAIEGSDNVRVLPCK